MTLDLETVPDEELVSAVDREPSRPYADKVGRLLAARRARSGGRSDFLPVPFHRPVVACSLEAVERDGALVVHDVGCWTDRCSSEGSFLKQTWDRLDGRTLVTFHGRGFDLPVLELRSLKLGLSMPSWLLAGRLGTPRQASTTEAHHDLLELLSNGGASPSAPLDLYAKLVGLPGKESVAGKDVAKLYGQGAFDQIAGYCMSDVVQTWLLYLRFRLFSGTLSPSGYMVSVAACRDELPALFAQRLDPATGGLLAGFLDRCRAFFDELLELPRDEGVAEPATTTTPAQSGSTRSRNAPGLELPPARTL
ncbi:MAG: exonuclease [Anaeromyxobacter sp. RBG_16_69_14]|nr:MAG: exonuclease [Anaeromyxobacter sp. RBG_16_69_14]